MTKISEPEYERDEWCTLIGTSMPTKRKITRKSPATYMAGYTRKVAITLKV